MIVKLQGDGWSVVWLLLAGFLFSSPGVAQTLHPRDFAVEPTAEVKKDPPQIVLKWRGDQYARNYTINRKSRSSNRWLKIGNAAGHETWFTDSNVATGIAYEYQVIKEGTLQYMGYGYIYAGIEVPVVEDRGRIILLVESSIAPALEFELKRLEFDLIGDGWRVVRRDVSRRAKVPEVKALIQSLYFEDPANTRGLLLFGNIPVPFSGNITPDEHDNHLGAWAADVYYADMDGVWTDTTVTSTSAERSSNHNVPGDGKFDQSEPPSAVELQVGRVDLSRMTCFSNKTPSRNEVDLLRLYLEKNHAYRHGRLPVEQRALISDALGLTQPEPLSTMAWRNFPPFVGTAIEVAPYGQYVTAVSQKSYLWAAHVAGGSYTFADAVGPSDVFATTPINAIFCMFQGSYYGDWDNESNFLRAGLGAQPGVLATLYSGQPQWICHTMALGESIGAAAQITQDNGPQGIYIPHNRGAGQVHVALHGDPTLRAHYVSSPSNVRATAKDGGLLLNWDPSTYPNTGYLVFEADSAAGTFRRISTSPLQSPSHFVPRAKPDAIYMVRAVTLTTSPSGSYWNASAGAFYPDPFASPTAPPPAPRDLILSEIRDRNVVLRWATDSASSWGFEVERQDPGMSIFSKIGSVSREKFDYVDSTAAIGGTYAYRVRAVNPIGASDYSRVVFANLQAASAEFVGKDPATQGSWFGKYGASGVLIPGAINTLPPPVSITSSNAGLVPYGYSDDSRYPRIPAPHPRSPNLWLNVFPFTLNLFAADDKTRQVSFYFLSGGKTDPAGELELIDAVTGNVLDRRTYENLNQGMYVTYKIRGSVLLKVIPPGWWGQTEIYGVFLDELRAQPVRIDPPGGSFASEALISMSTPTAGAEIRYTTDGSEPTLASTRYNEPFRIFSDTAIRARAFRDGFEPSPISEARFQNGVQSSAALIGWDESTSGSWVGKFGKDGFSIPNGATELPGYARVVGLSTPWVWAGITADRRGPYRDKTAGSRVAAAWYGDVITFDVAVSDTQRRAVALYFCDWDRKSRIQELEVLDAAGMVRDAYTIRDFASGKYLILGLKGFNKVRIRKVAGPNAILNGLMFDPAPVEVNVGASVPFGDPRVSHGILSFNAAGVVGQRFCLDVSDDLNLWSCFTTNTFNSPLAEIRIPGANLKHHQFLRGHIVP